MLVNIRSSYIIVYTDNNTRGQPVYRIWLQSYQSKGPASIQNMATISHKGASQYAEYGYNLSQTKRPASIQNMAVILPIKEASQYTE